MPSAADHLESRLAHVEVRLRRQRFAIALGATFLLASAFRGDTRLGPLRTTELQLIDAAGQRLAQLAPVAGGAALTLYDSAGRARLRLFHDTAQTALFLHDTTQTIRVGLAQFNHGGGGLALHGPHSRGAAVLYFKSRGTLTFYGDSGQHLYQVPERPD